ncbi:MAG: hypothetical protein V3V61_05230 [Gammaproteobacteria bacterium]
MFTLQGPIRNCLGTHTIGTSEGKNSQLTAQLADIGDIKKPKALEIINEVISSVSKWTLFADEAGVLSTSQKMIQSAIEKNISNNAPSC